MQAASLVIPAKRNIPINSLIFLHIAIGFLSVYVPPIPVIYISIYFLYSLLTIVQTSNRNDFATYAAAYLCGFEILIRLTGVVALYEFGKFSIIAVLLVAMAIEKKKKHMPMQAVMYFSLLLPSILVVHFNSFFEARSLLSFNLSGPLCLMVCWLYFSERKYTTTEIRKVFLFIVLPIIAIVPYIILKLPKDLALNATGQSSKAFSGGFGPNQVSVVLGFGFFIMAVALLLRLQITTSRVLDFTFMFILLAFAVLTFSRGGALTGVIAFLVSVFIYFRSGKGSKKMFRLLFGGIAFAITGYYLWQFLDVITNNSVSGRYESTVNVKNESKGAIDVSGRDQVVLMDIEAFYSHPILGQGPSGSVSFRSKKYDSIIVAHTEFTRLLGDHGLLGVFALIILLSAFFKYYLKSSGDSRIIAAGFLTICFLTMLHAAMRLAIPEFAFGLGLITIKSFNNPLESKTID